MATTIDAAFTGDIVSQSALRGFNDTLLPLDVFATDYGGELTQGNTTVNVPVYDANSGADTYAGSYITGAGGSVSNIPVVVDVHKKKTASFTDTQFANTFPSAIKSEEFGYQMGAGLAANVLADILSLVTAANFGAAAYTDVVANFDSDDVVDIKTVCDAANMTKVMRGLVLSDAYYNALLKDTSIKDASSYGSSDGIVAGFIPNVAGFKTWQTGGVPANAENLVGFACIKSAIAVAMRYLQPQRPESYDAANELSDPETGIVLGWRDHFDPNTGTRYMNLECNYGKAVGQAAGLKRIVSA